MTATRHLFRNREASHHAPVTYIELFFDLVFVFAITQLSHALLEKLDITGALQTLLLLFAVWWVWIYTAWSANWLDPERGNVRMMLLMLMLGGLVMSSAIPYAFGKTGWLFAAAYCSMQICRTLYMVWASCSSHASRARNFMRITAWSLFSVPFWIAGALADPDQRLLWWSAALLVEYAGPLLFFVTPGLGRSQASDWDISGAHMAERCALFIIVALGEGVLITGATFAKLPQDAARWSTFIVCFAGTAAMWWLYFDIGARRGSKVIGSSDAAGLLARSAYTYWHIPIVAGLVVTAVADELVLAHPFGHLDAAFILTAVGGPMLFLIGNSGFKQVTSGRRFPPLSHGIGLLALMLTGWAAWFNHWQPLVLATTILGVMVLTAMLEWASFNGGWQRWVPWAGRIAKARSIAAGEK